MLSWHKKAMFFFVGRGVQSCELKKTTVFEIVFVAPVGKLVGFAGPPGRRS